MVDPRSSIENHKVDANSNNIHVHVLSNHQLISTGQLHTFLCFHIRPINPVVYWELLPRRDGNLILKPASRLDAFSGYPFRT